MKLKTLLLTLVYLSMPLPAVSFGQDMFPMFEDLDSDSSGCISKDEAKSNPNIKRNFRKIDTDHDKKICIDEYTKYVNKGGNVSTEVEIPEPGAAPMQ